MGDSALVPPKTSRPALYLIRDPHAPIEPPRATPPLEVVAVGHEDVAAVAVEETRLPAIEIYLRVGFVPLLHPPDPDALCARWLAVHQQLGRPGKADQWPRDLAGFLD